MSLQTKEEFYFGTEKILLENPVLFVNEHPSIKEGLNKLYRNFFEGMAQLSREYFNFENDFSAYKNIVRISLKEKAYVIAKETGVAYTTIHTLKRHEELDHCKFETFERVYLKSKSLINIEFTNDIINKSNEELKLLLMEYHSELSDLEVTNLRNWELKSLQQLKKAESLFLGLVTNLDVPKKKVEEFLNSNIKPEVLKETGLSYNSRYELVKGKRKIVKLKLETFEALYLLSRKGTL
ncbi:hypothetical protein [Lactococcus petauri]|uniref:Uncharacterized protein n=1 Tax=Lactococcus petauri TaxID=1940789 RepID=A0A252CFD6_9LACT|nr:hypothetical protein [Lactococcus petauri]OUK05248.1 hypothetical protein BZZ03_00590 [Lactococcus petauri]